MRVPAVFAAVGAGLLRDIWALRPENKQLTSVADASQQNLSPCIGQPDPEQQLNGDVLKAICEKIQQNGTNFLVFGLGRDSDFWYNNVGGKVLFLENHPDWLDFQTPRVKEATRLVSYSTDIKDFRTVLQDTAKLNEFFDRLPSEVVNTRWDAILVDSPMGMEERGRPIPGFPGRMQSVNAALRLAHPGTVIFVDDWQRTVERHSTDMLLAPHTQHRVVFDNGHEGKTAMFVVNTDSSTHSVIPSALVQKEDLSPCIGQPDPLQQLNGEILKAICANIQHHSANFLVFGLGRDSDFWFNNVAGKVLFLENHPDWLEFQTPRVREATRLVQYSTDIKDFDMVLQDQKRLDELFNSLPAEVLETRWDAILVDSPMGMEQNGRPQPGNPGRMQSINAALKLAHPGTTIFVDDWQRKVERASTDKLLAPHTDKRLVFDNGHEGLTAMFTVNPDRSVGPVQSALVQQQDLSPCIGATDPEQQLNGDILKAICTKIRQDGANFLVFGLGRDSAFWYKNAKGKARFLENHRDWLKFQSEDVKAATHLVSYTTVIEEFRTVLHDQAKLDEFYTSLPDDILNTHWDAILVDSPMGMDGAPGVPGRMQSVHAALKLAKTGTAVFVDDWQRKVERRSADTLLAPHSTKRNVYDNGHGGLTAMYIMK